MVPTTIITRVCQMNKININKSILGMMLIALSAGAIADGKSSDAYFVKVDRDTTTQNTEQGAPNKKHTSRKEKSGGLATGKRQHKPLTITKSIDKASPQASGKKKKVPGIHKSGDITLKRGVID